MIKQPSQAATSTTRACHCWSASRRRRWWWPPPPAACRGRAAAERSQLGRPTEPRGPPLHASLSRLYQPLTASLISNCRCLGILQEAPMAECGPGCGRAGCTGFGAGARRMYRSPGRWTGTPYRTGCRVECLGDVESSHRGKVTWFGRTSRYPCRSIGSRGNVDVNRDPA